MLELPVYTKPIVQFRCNICSTENKINPEAFNRELPDCTGCGSTPRFRGLALALTQELFGKRMVMEKVPVSKHIRGLGMSDWEPLASLLREKFDHLNTFYHTEPRYDVMAGEPSDLGGFDYVICSEVFEHVIPPLQCGFENLRKLLKPGGNLIFSTPYTAAPDTTEHFPGLRDFRLCQLRGEWILVNFTEDGEISLHDNLIFHGGPGTVVEMRVFGEAHLLGMLRDAGFVDVRPMIAFDFEYGYHWGVDVHRPEIGYPSLNYIITATAL